MVVWAQVHHRLAIGLELLGNGEKLLPELRTDDAALRFRLGNAGEELSVAVFSVNVDEVNVELLGEYLLDLLGLAPAKQAVVDEHAGHLLAHGARAKGSDHGGVDAARRARITRSSPTFSRNSAVMVSTRLSMSSWLRGRRCQTGSS